MVAERIERIGLESNLQVGNEKYSPNTTTLTETGYSQCEQ